MLSSRASAGASGSAAAEPTAALKVVWPRADDERVAPHTFTLFLSGGAVVLAAWLVARFPRLVPKTKRQAAGWAAAAGVAFALTPPSIIVVGGIAGFFPAIFGIALPGIVCVFLGINLAFAYAVRAMSPHLR